MRGSGARSVRNKERIETRVTWVCLSGQVPKDASNINLDDKDRVCSIAKVRES